MNVIISNEEQFDDQGSTITILTDPRGSQTEFDVFMLTYTLDQSLRRKHYKLIQELISNSFCSSLLDYNQRLEELFFSCLYREMGIILKLQKEDRLSEVLFELSRDLINKKIDELFPGEIQQGLYQDLIAISEQGSAAGAQVMLDFFNEL